MRLVCTRTLRLQEFPQGSIPPYAILSHTWRKHEVSLQAFKSLQRRKPLQGSRFLRGRRFRALLKIHQTCRQARLHGLDYAWIDTCCIDKTSSTELQEAINSMFKWYQNSAICFAFLEDVRTADRRSQAPPRGVSFGRSRWFTRGWTLQEMIAPGRLAFFNSSWRSLGERSSMTDELESITGVDAAILAGGPLKNVSVGRRMSWAIGRQTTREEDLAYSLFGIFNVNLPLLYGEGSQAFLRLQEEVLRRTDDDTIFAWREPAAKATGLPHGLLAPSPQCFRNFRTSASLLGSPAASSPSAEEGAFDNILHMTNWKLPNHPVTLTNRGIQIRTQVQHYNRQSSDGLLFLVLKCMFGSNPGRVVGILLQRQGDRYVRVKADRVFQLMANENSSRFEEILCARSQEDTNGGYHDEPLVSKFKLMDDLESEASIEGRTNVASQKYKGAFLIRRSMLHKMRLLKGFRMNGLLVVSSSGLPRMYRDATIGDIVVKADPESVSVLMLTNSFDESVLICLGATQKPEGWRHWTDAAWLQPDDFREPMAITRLIKLMRSRRTEHPPQSCLVVDEGNGQRVRVTFATEFLYGVRLHAVDLGHSWWDVAVASRLERLHRAYRGGLSGAKSPKRGSMMRLVARRVCPWGNRRLLGRSTIKLTVGYFVFMFVAMGLPLALLGYQDGKIAGLHFDGRQTVRADGSWLSWSPGSWSP